MKNHLINFFTKKHSSLASFLLIFLIYILITLLLFSHRLPNITTHYGMPDVDADGGLWYTWYLIFTETNGYLYYINEFFSYPFGFDITFMPFRNLVYVSQAFIMQHIIGFTPENLILLTNVSTLITYPLSAIGAYLLCYYITKNKTASFFAGLIFSFSYYHVHMARAQLSVNHIEIIPYYFLSLLYFLDKKNLFSLVLSTLLFALLFNTDAYYAFFSGLLSPFIVFLYKKEGFLKKFKVALIYYSVLFIILLAINFNFFVTNFYLFNAEEAVATGRDSIPKNELLNILYYFVPPEFSFLKTYVPYLGYITYLIVPLIAFTGLLFLNRNRVYLMLFLCFLVAVIVSAYTPYSYWINELYFKYFGIFRGVARMVLLSYLFLGVMAGISIAAFMRSKYFKNLNGKQYFAAVLLLTTIIIGNVINVDRAWWRLSDFSKEVSLYEPIKNNDNIKAIATFPMTQNNKIAGCPETFQIKAQIIHNKAFACGASPFDPYAQKHYKMVSDINNEGTIEYLTKYNIDTIMIYNKLLKNASQINKALINDARIVYIGRYTGTYDIGYTSTTDNARDVSVYQIKKVVEENQTPKPYIYSDDPKVKVTYEKVSPSRYEVSFANVTDDTRIVFNSPYSNKWQLYAGDNALQHDFAFNFAQSINENIRFQEYRNSWIINPATKHATIFFGPQAVFSFGSLLSLITFLLLSIYLIIHILYDKLKR